jgi:hypothetical protein
MIPRPLRSTYKYRVPPAISLRRSVMLNLTSRFAIIASGTSTAAFALVIIAFADLLAMDRNSTIELGDAALSRIIGSACCNATLPITDCNNGQIQDECANCTSGAGTGGQPPTLTPCQAANGKLWYGGNYTLCKTSTEGRHCLTVGQITCHTTFTCTAQPPQEGTTCNQNVKVCEAGAMDSWCRECRRTGTGANPETRITSICEGEEDCLDE